MGTMMPQEHSPMGTKVIVAQIIFQCLNLGVNLQISMLKQALMNEDGFTTSYVYAIIKAGFMTCLWTACFWSKAGKGRCRYTLTWILTLGYIGIVGSAFDLTVLVYK